MTIINLWAIFICIIYLFVSNLKKFFLLLFLFSPLCPNFHISFAHIIPTRSRSHLSTCLLPLIIAMIMLCQNGFDQLIAFPCRYTPMSPRMSLAGFSVLLLAPFCIANQPLVRLSTGLEFGQTRLRIMTPLLGTK